MYLSLFLSLQKHLQSSIKIWANGSHGNAPVVGSLGLHVGREPEVNFITNCMKGIQRHFDTLL